MTVRPRWCDGEIVSAAQEERFSRVRHDSGFPAKAVEYFTAAGITLDDVDHIVFYDKPFLKFERLLETYLAFAPRGFRSFSKVIPVWSREKLFQKRPRDSRIKSSARISGRWPAAGSRL